MNDSNKEELEKLLERQEQEHTAILEDKNRQLLEL